MTTTYRDASSSVPALPVVEPRTRIGRLWLDAPLRRKLLSIVGAMALMWVTPIVVAAVLSVRLDDARARARASDANVVAAHELELSLLTSNGAIEAYLTSALEDVGPIERDRAVAAEMRARLAALQDTLPATVLPALDEAAPAIDAVVAAGDAVSEFGAAGTLEVNVSTDPARVELDPRLVDALVARIEAAAVANEAIEAIEEEVRARAVATREDVVRYQEDLVQATLVSLVLVLVLGAGAMFVVSKGIVRRVEGLSDNADRYVRGDALLPSPASADEVGQLTDKMLFTADLLDKRRAQAVDATRAKDEFLTRVSHELKTPLTAMIGFGQLLEEDGDLPPSHRADAAHIVRAGHQLHGLIEKLLDIRAIEAGKLAITCEVVPVWEPVDEAITLVEAMPESRSVTIAADCPPDLVVAADRRRLREVLVALIAHAVKNTEVGGRVDLAAARRPDDRVRISVSDTGPGLRPDDEQRVLRPRERRNRAGVADDEGTGAGPALTRHLVDAMHGTMGGTSEAGVATTVWVDLPVEDDASGASAGDVAPAGDDPPSATAARRIQTTRAKGPLVPPAPRAGTRVVRWWLDLPLGRKLPIASLAPVLLWVPPIVMGLVVNSRLDDARAQTELSAEKSETLDSLHDSLQTSASAMYLFATSGLTDAALVDESRAASAAIPEEIASLRADLPADLLPATQDVEEKADAVVESLEALAALGEESAGDIGVSGGGVTFGSGASPALGAALVDSFETSAAAQDSIGELEQRLDEDLVEERREVDRLEDLLVRTTLVTMVAALVVAAVGSYVVSNGVVRRIELLSGNADRFIRRERLLPAPESADEIGRLTDTMHFAGKLLYRRREQAVAATRAKDEFLSRVSHELEAPVTTMIGLARRIAADTTLSPDSRSDAAHIVSAGHHLRELIEELLDIKAIEAGKLAIATEAVSVCASADEVLSLVRSMPASRTIAIDADCAPDLVVAADPRRLREVLLNLLSNAVKYNCPGGRVDLAATRRPDDRVRISVTDTGPGIAPEDQELVFAPFERLGADETEIEGSGVGLALTRHVVHAMQGTIGLESTLGRGTTFWVDLPAFDDRDARSDDGPDDGRADPRADDRSDDRADDRSDPRSDARPATGPMTGTG